MDFSVIHASLDRINLDDRTYQITTRSQTDDLALSIGAVGLLQPPAVIEADGRFRVVCGFRRITALLSLDMGQADIPLRLLPHSTPPMTLAAIAISDNTFQRPLNVVEQSRGYALLKRFCDPPEAWQQVARSSGLPASAKAASQILPIVQMPEALQRAIIEGSIALPVACQILRLDSDDGQALIDLLRRITTGLNVQREIIELIADICHRDAIPISRFLDRDRIRDILENQSTSTPQKVQQLRNLLKTERFPALRRAEANYRHTLKELCLAPQLQIHPPPFFEGKTYQVSLRIESRSQLRELQSELDKLAASSALLPE
jgi:ParB family transcriptional regulator, chromosome partitioning protein